MIVVATGACRAAGSLLAGSLVAATVAGCTSWAPHVDEYHSCDYVAGRFVEDDLWRVTDTLAEVDRSVAEVERWMAQHPDPDGRTRLASFDFPLTDPTDTALVCLFEIEPQMMSRGPGTEKHEVTGIGAFTQRGWIGVYTFSTRDELVRDYDSLITP